MNDPLVSVLIPLHNKADWIGATLQSALAQTYRNIEVFVVDDGSTDGSAEVIRAVDDARLKVISRENRGANATRNELLIRAAGEFVQYLDADDVLAPCKLTEQVDDLLHGASVSICGVRRRGRALPPVGDGNVIDASSLVRFGVHTTAPLHRKASLVAVGGWSERLPAAQEWDLHCRLHLAGAWSRPVLRDEVLALWTDVPGSISSNERSVYRAKIMSIATIAPQSDGAIRQAFAESAINAGRHLARDGLRHEARDAFRLAAQLSKNTGAAWPRRLRWLARTPLAPAAEWGDFTTRTLISRPQRQE